MAQLTLQSVKDSGSLAGAPVKREIEWHNLEGDLIKADIWVRQGSYHTITHTWKAAEGNQEHLAARIATMVCDEEGGPVFTTQDVLGSETQGAICAELFLALITAVNDVNSGKKNPPKTSGSK